LIGGSIPDWHRQTPTSRGIVAIKLNQLLDINASMYQNRRISRNFKEKEKIRKTLEMISTFFNKTTKASEEEQARIVWEKFSKSRVPPICVALQR